MRISDWSSDVCSSDLGVLPSIPWIKDVIRHEQSGLLVDPKRGLIYGANGTPIGGVCADGYVRLGGRSGYLYAHRVIYEVVHGEIPAGLEIDHRNSKRADNRIVNLDAVTHSENVRRAVANGQAPDGEARSDAQPTEPHVGRAPVCHASTNAHDT